MHRAWALYEAKFKADATDRTERGGSAGDAQQNEDLLLSILSGHMGQVYGPHGALQRVRPALRGRGWSASAACSGITPR